MGDPSRPDVAVPPSADSATATPEELQRLLGHQFHDPALLAEALTHPSAGNVSGLHVADFERMEFLGDRVLGLVVAGDLARRFPAAGAGELALRYNALVRREACAKVAHAVGLGGFVRMARGERAAGGATKPAILADACEALIGALYVDGGLPAALGFIQRYWGPLFEEQAGVAKDPKTMLQEWTHRRKFGPPVYRMLATDGPPHAPTFRVEVTVPGFGSADGHGPSKRTAEQEAAAALLRNTAVLPGG